jgi:hypothetical protein
VAVGPARVDKTEAVCTEAEVGGMIWTVEFHAAHFQSLKWCI